MLTLPFSRNSSSGPDELFVWLQSMSTFGLLGFELLMWNPNQPQLPPFLPQTQSLVPSSPERALESAGFTAPVMVLSRSSPLTPLLSTITPLPIETPMPPPVKVWP